ncbi:MAG: helix-turn-helix domain-containing protein [bacterium]|nr:helix-turn-helix domain-containing protein [bacterium]
MNRKEYAQEIALRLKKVRNSLGYSRPGMAKALDILRSSYYRLEKGISVPDLITQARLALKMGVSLDWMLLNRGEMHYKKEVSQESGSGEDHLKGLLVEEPGGEVADMLEHMKKIPQLHHELLAAFHNFKEERSGLVEKLMTPPK